MAPRQAKRKHIIKRLRSKMAPNPTSAGDEESTSNVSAEYQEWHMRGVFKQVIVGDWLPFSSSSVTTSTNPVVYSSL
jgi:hypothetical protein